ncbi:hypothetical protein CSUNSWCD_1179 [Campylobacter showae CSUNSWCD]|uniref:Uncharacterized protein n=1 Tax=Campylobacter showae CSUNSWCD TaxID=1244083 RepID=M5IL52_9BACT|nr:hypothetical protein CSUNSWCD_1179 [Campylobacter showae CSUNSWCD]
MIKFKPYKARKPNYKNQLYLAFWAHVQILSLRDMMFFRNQTRIAKTQ